MRFQPTTRGSLPDKVSSPSVHTAWFMSVISPFTLKVPLTLSMALRAEFCVSKLLQRKPLVWDETIVNHPPLIYTCGTFNCVPRLTAQPK